ncbi:MAG TPA: hypothetical protein VIR58_01455 [Acidimicrobiales bacterium]
MATQQLVSSVSSFLARHSDRRGFLRRSALVGSALAAAPTAYALKPGSAYAAVCSCSGSRCNCGSRCCDGYTEFCCTLNGENRCPPGSIMAGWWKADGSGFCGTGAPRYYMDCNAGCGGCGCGGSGLCGGECSGTPCGCANGNCGNRKAGCTRFRYGQCNQATRCVGPIICRVISCSPPWSFDASCTRSVATDNNTRFHDAPCLHEPVIKPAPADLIAFKDGVWKLRHTQSEGAPENTFSYGQPGDVPLIGDWDGDGNVGIGVRRGRTFILRNSASAGAPDHIFDWGRPEDIPLVGDWNANGRDTVGLRRGHTWFLKNRLDDTPHEIQFDWGRPEDVPLVGDWDGDGRTGVGIRRGGRWYLKNTLDGGPHDTEFPWARPEDIPVTGDWNGDGSTGIGVVRGNRWYLKNVLDSSGHHSEFSYGDPGDTFFGWDQSS